MLLSSTGLQNFGLKVGYCKNINHFLLELNDVIQLEFDDRS